MAGGAWQHGPQVAHVQAENRVVALDLVHAPDAPQVLSPSAAAVWQAIDGQRSDEAIVAEVADAYGVAPEEIAADVRQFLADLAASGLIVRRE